MPKRVAVIGGGFAGLSGAALLAKEGVDVTLFDKHAMLGGRAQKLEKDGFTFDMGPSWYWMPEVFEEFFKLFGHSASDFYELERLDPSYRVYFGKDDFVDVPAKPEAFLDLVERLEPGGAKLVQQYLREAEYKYNIGMSKFVHKPGLSFLEFVDPKLLSVFHMDPKLLRVFHMDPKLQGSFTWTQNC